MSVGTTVQSLDLGVQVARDVHNVAGEYKSRNRLHSSFLKERWPLVKRGPSVREIVDAAFGFSI